ENTQLKKVIQPNAFFYSHVFPGHYQTLVTIPYSFEGETPIIMLELDTQHGNEKINRLVSHPIFDKLDWEFIESEPYRLYQKESTHDSLEAFLTNPPAGSQILADPRLVVSQRFKHLQAKALDETSTPQKANYILTT